MNCLNTSMMRFSVPVRHYGTLFQVRKDWIFQSQHYIGTDKIRLPARCTSNIVPRDLLVKTTKEFLLSWDTQKLNAFQKVCEMDLWQTFFCNSHIGNRGTKEICFKREDSKTEYWIEVVGSQADELAIEWRKSVLVPDTVPFLTELAPLVSHLPFNWQRYETHYWNRVSNLEHFGLVRRDKLNIQCENGFGNFNSDEDLKGPLDKNYAELYKLSMMNPFIAFNFSNASSIRELLVLTAFQGGSHRLITLKQATK